MRAISQKFLGLRRVHILMGEKFTAEYVSDCTVLCSITLPASTATEVPTTTPLPRLDMDAELYASEITKMSAKVSWRSFSDYELQYIDGIQVKYTQKNNLVRSKSSVSASH